MPAVCAEFSDLESLLKAIRSTEINSKYDTKKLDSDTNEGYLRTFRRRVGVLYRCAMKTKFGERASKVFDKTREMIGTDAIFIDGRKGNDIVVVKRRGSWKIGKIYLSQPGEGFEEASDASFSPKNVGELEYDDIKGHLVPNWEDSLEKTTEELRWIELAVVEMINVENDPEGANKEEYVYCLEE